MSGARDDCDDGPGSEATRDQLAAELIDAFLTEQQAGRRPDPQQLLAGHPELADRLRAGLFVMRLADSLAEDLGTRVGLARAIQSVQALSHFATQSDRSIDPIRPGMRDPPRDADDAPIPVQLGDFRIVREVGRGGMGIVYEAEQLSLGRRVALKVLPFAAALDPRQRLRFQHEARAAAGLHHPRIVPVHAVGEAAGVPYLVMEFIDGCSIAELIRAVRPSVDLGQAATEPVAFVLINTLATGPDGGARPSAATVDMAVDVAPSPEVAKAPTTPRGKSPSAGGTTASMPGSDSAVRNLAFIRAVAELGIQAAEAIEHAHQMGVIHRDIKPANLMLDLDGQLWITDFGLARLADDGGLTITGDLVGTICYMSPEQATGGRQTVVDHRTDVYSLGATLYEMLAAVPAFTGEDRCEVLRRILEEQPRPLRQLNPAVPRELETILHKAMAKEPAGRYATAQALADDLRRFLDDRPIAARRTTPLERVVKWSRRHKPLVVAGVVVLMVLVAVLAPSMILVWRERNEALAHKELAEERYAMARSAVDELYDETANKWLSSEIINAPMPSRFLQRALQFYQGFSEARGTDHDAIHNACRARLRVGEILLQLGRKGEAEAALRQAEAIFREQLQVIPSDTELRHDLALCHLRLGQSVFTEETVQQAVASFEVLVRDDPGNSVYRRELGFSLHHLGCWYWESWRPPRAEAEGYLRRALTIQERLVAVEPEYLDHQRALGQTLRDLGSLRRDSGRLDEADPYYRHAAAIHEALLERAASFPAFRLNLAWDFWERGKLMIRLGRFAEGVDLEAKAVAAFSTLAVEYPDTEAYRWHLGESYAQLAYALLHAGPCPAAEAALRQVLPGFGSGRGEPEDEEPVRRWRRALAVLEKAPATTQVTINRAHAHGAFGTFLRARGREQEADAELLIASRINEPLLEGCRSEADRRPDDLDAVNTYACALVLVPDPNRVAPLRTVALARKVVGRAPSDAYYRKILGAAEYRAGQWDAAITSLEASLALTKTGAWTADTWIFLAQARWRRGEANAARACYGRAREEQNRWGPFPTWSSTLFWDMELLCAQADALMREDATMPTGPDAFAH